MATADSWWAYIIYSDKIDKFYTGISTDPFRRLRAHNGMISGGAKATRAGRPWRLVWWRIIGSKSRAQKYEAKLKKLSRFEKNRLVNRDYIACEHCGRLTGR